MNTTELMRQDWDERARKDAFHYIASWREDWNLEAFYQSGEDDYQRFVAPLLGHYGWEPTGKSVLELGCGVGRMTHSFARRFSRVIAFDISSEMLLRGRALASDSAVTNVDWTLGNGADISGVEDEAVDFVFSYLVLQHMPTADLALRYIREMLRVLRPGGRFLFQFNSIPKMAMNWKGRTAWHLVDLPWALGFRGASRSLASLLGLSPEIAGKSWRGAPLNVTSVRATIEKAGATVEQMDAPGTPMTWCCGSKPGHNSHEDKVPLSGGLPVEPAPVIGSDKVGVDPTEGALARKE